MGGGGFMSRPQISPWTERPGLAFVGCDMGAVYRTEDLGASGWTMLDEREVRSSSSYTGGYYDQGGSPAYFTRLFSVALDPSHPGRVFGSTPRASGLLLQLSSDYGVPGSWGPLLPAPPVALSEVTAAAFSRDGQYLLVASPEGLFRYQFNPAGGTGSWVTGASADTPPVSLAAVLWLAIPKALNGTLWFAASHQYVFLSTDQGATWRRFDSGLPAGPSNHIQGFAAGGATNVVLLASIATTSLSPFDGGIRRSVVTSATSPAPSWSNASSGLQESSGTDDHGNPDGTMPQYRELAVDEDNPDARSYVALLNTFRVDPMTHTVLPFYSIYRWDGTTWSGGYDGFQSHQPYIPVKAEAGWIDEREPHDNPPGLGWGMGGAPSGLAVDPKNSARIMFTNTAFVNVSEDGGSGSANPSWRQRYTRPAPSTLPDQWQSSGLDVTSVWNYRIHKNLPNVHFLCSTDIGLARSTSAGEWWASITPRYTYSYRDNSGTIQTATALWNNCYDVAVEEDLPTGARVWAAVAAHHDLPLDKELAKPLDPFGSGDRGGVLVSTDDGATWGPYTATGLPRDPTSGVTYPVVSLAYDPTAGFLYASVWGKGVYGINAKAAGGAWAAVGSLAVPRQAEPHCGKIALAGTRLYCAVAANKTATPFASGGLYSIANPSTAGAGTAWTTETAGLTVTGTLHPIDFAFDPAGNLYLATSSVSGSTPSPGGLYVRRAGAWTAVDTSGITASGYTGQFDAYSVFFSGGLLFLNTTSHGTWFQDAADAWHEYKALPFLPVLRAADGPASGGASPPRYFTTFGGGAWVLPRTAYLTPDHSAVAKQEVDQSLAAHGGTIHQVAVLTLDGFAGPEVGITGPAALPAVEVTLGGASAASITGRLTNLQMTSTPPDVDALQCFTCSVDLTFANTDDFPTSPGGPATPVTLTVRAGSLILTTAVRLIYSAHPYMLDGPIGWLSDDTRVFAVVQGRSPYNNPAYPAYASTDTPTSYLGRFVASLTDASFDSLPKQEDQSPLQIWPNDQGTGAPVFNFAVARVHYQGPAPVANAKVFFRVSGFPSTGLAYDDAHLSRRYPDPTVRSVPDLPLLGVGTDAAGNNFMLSIPCFGDARQLDMTAQTDSLHLTSLPLPTPTGPDPVSVFTGCWLDINQPGAAWYPDPPTYATSYVGAPNTQSVQHFVVRHQCLLVEVHYPEGPADSLAAGDTPGSSDCYSQRNLSILGVANPGREGSRTVAHPFLIRAGEPAQEAGAAHEELLLWWGDLPRAARVTLQMAGVAADEVLALARGRYGSLGLSVAGADTLRCVPRGVTYVPLPAGRGVIAALLTIALPGGVRYGQRFQVVVQHSGRPRRVVGAFTVDVPVLKAEALLRDAENTLAVMRYHTLRAPEGHPWRRILENYVAVLARRVDGLGGESGRIPPSPNGAPGETPRRGCLLGWLDALRGALARPGHL